MKLCNKKIIKALCKIKFKKQKKLFLETYILKEIGAMQKDYVEAMWKILQHKSPEDFVICTGKQYSIKDFINLVSKELKVKKLNGGERPHEKAYNENNQPILE